jgi:hypothetical protein
MEGNRRHLGWLRGDFRFCRGSNLAFVIKSTLRLPHGDRAEDDGNQKHCQPGKNAIKSALHRYLPGTLQSEA